MWRPRSVPDLSILDDLPEEPVDRIKAFRKLNMGGVIEGSSLGPIALVSSKEFAKEFPDVVCYLPEEIDYLLLQDDHTATVIHRTKKMGGFLEIKKEKTSDLRSNA